MKIYEAEKLIRENKISPVELKNNVLEKINAENKSINAYITLDNVTKNAENLPVNNGASPLWGIPLAIKDNICTKGLTTTAGSRILEGFVPPYDATVMERLKMAGGVITGKTNMDEFGMGSESSNGAFGMVHNPINPIYIPGGSSGGSAAAVKSGMALGALGTDTGGSVRQPAAFCGLYGLKPTYSLVSRYGLIAFASSLDTIGTITKSAKDAAIILDVIAGYDEKDTTSSQREKESYYKSIKSSVKGIKIGLPEEFYENMDEDVKEEVLKAAKNLELMGAKVEECSFKSLKYAVSAYYIISSAEASSNLARYDAVAFGKRCESFATLEEMYSETRSKFFGDEVKRRIILGTYVLSKEYYSMYYMRAKTAQKMLADDFNKLFTKYDVLLTPVSKKRVWERGSCVSSAEVYTNDMCTAAVSLAGLPAMSVPCGVDKNNMCVGMQLIGKKFDEQLLINIATAYEEGGFYCGA